MGSQPMSVAFLYLLTAEKHATESHKEGESAIKLDPLSFVVETPFHQATMERPAGLSCVEKIGLARLRLLSNCPSVSQGRGHYWAAKEGRF